MLFWQSLIAMPFSLAYLAAEASTIGRTSALSLDVQVFSPLPIIEIRESSKFQ